MVGLAATLLFVHGQTTERTINAAERLACALGETVKILPYWGEITVPGQCRSANLVDAADGGFKLGRDLAETLQTISMLRAGCFEHAGLW